MHVRPMSALLLVPVAACASSSAGSERGLGALRQELGLMPPQGHVERDGHGTWVIDDELGVRLAAIEPDGAKCGGTSDTSAVWRLYEGSPNGAALSFMGAEATLWWHDAAAGCVMAQRVFASPVPDNAEALGVADWSSARKATPDANAEDAANDEPAVETDPYGAVIESYDIAPDGQPSVKALISANQIEIVGASGDVLFSDAGSTEDGACGTTIDASLSRAVRADGKVLLGYSQAIKVSRPYEGDETGCEGDTVEVSAGLELWVAVDARAQTAEQVYRETNSSGGQYGGSSSATRFVVGLPVGALVFERSEDDAGFESRNSGPTVSWSWSFMPAKGDPITLTSTPSY